VSLSPDERWLAYASNVTGQEEIWVQPYGGPGAPVRVSPNGGREPLWAKNGKELYYLEGRRLMAVAVDARERFDFKPARLLMESEYSVTNGVTNQPPSYDVGPDGRFLMLKPSADDQRFQPIVVILNWFEELQQLVPVR
jgi:Tol biopolymer transport system component